MSSSSSVRTSEKSKRNSVSKPVNTSSRDSPLPSKLNIKKCKSTKKLKPKVTSRNVESVTSAGLKWDQEKPREWDPYEDGDYSKMPHETPNAVNFIGGIGANIGHRRSKKFINRTNKVEQIYNMRNDNKPIFSFCEDPLKANNVPPRKKITDVDERFANEIANKISGIKHEQHLQTIDECESSTSTSISNTTPKQSNAESNMDHVEANRKRNTEIRNQFLTQRRALQKGHIESQLPIDRGFDYRKEKFRLSEYFDVDKDIPEEEAIESIRKVVIDWTEAYKVNSHECDLKFARPMPEAIPMPSEREKLAFLTRTLDKPPITQVLNQEIQMFSKQIEDTAIENIKRIDAARQLEKLLNKKRIETLPIDIGTKDFDEFVKASGVFDIGESKMDDKNLARANTHPKETLISAMKNFEEKITQRLSPISETRSIDSVHEESSIEPEKKKTMAPRKQPFHKEDAHLPVDFTFPFDINRNERLKKFIRPKYKSKPVADIQEAPSERLRLCPSEMNITSDTLKEESGKPIQVKDEKNKLRNKPEDTLKRGTLDHKNSICTNFTDDSGSFIVVQENKLHFHDLKPSSKTLQQKPVHLEAKYDEYLRPYKVLSPKEAKVISKRDPKLVPTFDTRERLKVDITSFETELLGIGQNKYLNALATEWDEYYQKEILNRPRIRRFKPRTIMKQIMDSLRLKYESIYKREYLTEKTIIIEQEKLFMKKAQEFRDVCLEFFSNLQTTNYRQSMAVIQELRPIYELNDKLMSEYTTVNNKLIQLKTAIIRAEGKVREATILQNVSYLMKEPNWREKNDWIHKRPDGTFETIKESIEKRMTTNLRKKDNDNVWAIKEFFEKKIFPNKRPALVAFASPDAINSTIANFKTQLYLSLLKLDLSTWTLMNLKHAYDAYTKWSKDFIAQRQRYVEACCARKYFQEDCAAHLETNAVELIDGKLVETISEKTLRTMDSLCNVVYVSLIPKNVQDQFKGGTMLDKFRLIADHAMNLLEKLDAIPSVVRKEVEGKIRKENGFIERRTKRAIDLETYIGNARKIMVKNSTPTYQRPPRIGKLPRSYMPKPKVSSKVVKADADADVIEMVPLTIQKEDFEALAKETHAPQDYYLDATFFGGDVDIPNIDFLPEMKANIDEFIVDVKNILDNWQQNKQGRYLEDAHLAWKATYSK